VVPLIVALELLKTFDGELTHDQHELGERDAFDFGVEVAVLQGHAVFADLVEDFVPVEQVACRLARDGGVDGDAETAQHLQLLLVHLLGHHLQPEQQRQERKLGDAQGVEVGHVQLDLAVLVCHALQLQKLEFVFVAFEHLDESRLNYGVQRYVGLDVGVNEVARGHVVECGEHFLQDGQLGQLRVGLDCLGDGREHIPEARLVQLDALLRVVDGADLEERPLVGEQFVFYQKLHQLVLPNRACKSILLFFENTIYF